VVIRPTRFTPPTGETKAVAEQEKLRALVDVTVLGPDRTSGGLFVGVDVAYDDARDRVVAGAVVLGAVVLGAVVLDAADLRFVEQATATGRISFLYLPGLLAFRELPAVLDALSSLHNTPDLIVCDGYGIAHPRRLGLASHLGVLTGISADPGGLTGGDFVPAFRTCARTGCEAERVALGVRVTHVPVVIRCRRQPQRVWRRVARGVGVVVAEVVVVKPGFGIGVLAGEAERAVGGVGGGRWLRGAPEGGA
jgi:hypothetical protein